MNEHEFLQTLQERAKEQEKIINGVLFPRFFSLVSIWLGEHPWRILIPIAFIISLFLHFTIGRIYDTFILKIFGGFGIIHFQFFNK
jgi:hypothetical protein